MAEGLPEAEPLHPLVLSSVMRARLDGAVRALLGSPGLVGQSDAVRFAAVVLMARTPADGGVVTIRKGELGRWCGSSKNYMKSVLRVLRGAGLPEGVRPAVVDVPDDGTEGSVDTLRVRVVPLWEAMMAGRNPSAAAPERIGHGPLALDQAELSVLFHLVEFLFAPGWVFRNRDPMVGLLASRAGRGAATDRLALLLMVLSASSRGRVRLCGGRVDTRAGRPAVTVARMLGCSPDGAANVLARLEEYGIVARPRRGASGLRSRARVVIPAVAAAYKATGMPSTAGAGKARLHSVPQPVSPVADGVPGVAGEDPAASLGEEFGAELWWDLDGEPEPEEPPFADPADGEDRFEDAADFGSCLAVATPAEQAPAGAEEDQVSGVESVQEDGVADLAAATPLHSEHSSVADVGGCADLVDGFSGAGAAGVTHRRPERAGAREERGTTACTSSSAAGPVGSASGPLRGEQRVIELRKRRKDRSGRGRSMAHGQVGRLLDAFGMPRDRRLADVVAPVADVWHRIGSASTRAFVLTLMAAELDAVAAWSGMPDAPEMLAGRLDFRRRRQGAVPITDPVGWLRERGLPKGTACPEAACDDGIRLDTGRDCTACELRIADRRSIRLILTRKVVAALPGDASEEQRRAAVEDALSAHIRGRQEALAAARQRVAAELARWEAGRPEREARAAEAERARRALPCEDCRSPEQAGLCGNCRITRAIVGVSLECLDLVLIRVDQHAPVRVAEARERAVDDLRSAREQARDSAVAGREGEALGVDPLLLAELVALEVLRDTEAVRSLAHCALLPAASREAEAAYAAALRSRHRHPTPQAAVEAAGEQAHLARHRAARWIFDRRLADIVRRREEDATSRVAAREAQGAVRLAGRSLVEAAVQARRAEELAVALDLAARECTVMGLAFWADLADAASRDRTAQRAAVSLEEVRAEARARHARLDGYGQGLAELRAVRDLCELWREMALDGYASSGWARREGDAARAVVLGRRGSAEREVLLARAEREARIAREKIAEKILGGRICEVHRLLGIAAAAPAEPEGGVEAA
ncbi:hypothetical protein [Kitasatospora sp. NPDC088783]|uniref:hypothetical protein n=1 Tax=Kitasatospora sp. NPDC088783 TaxID=3364077 RepID=UPI00381ECB90